MLEEDEFVLEDDELVLEDELLVDVPLDVVAPEPLPEVDDEDEDDAEEDEPVEEEEDPEDADEPEPDEDVEEEPPTSVPDDEAVPPSVWLGVPPVSLPTHAAPARPAKAMYADNVLDRAITIVPPSSGRDPKAAQTTPTS